MDASRFDRLARLVSTKRTRRQARRLPLGVGGAVALGIPQRPLVAAPTCLRRNTVSGSSETLTRYAAACGVYDPTDRTWHAGSVGLFVPAYDRDAPRLTGVASAVPAKSPAAALAGAGGSARKPWPGPAGPSPATTSSSSG